MATYNPASVGIKPPAGGFQQGGWYGGRQFWGGTLSDPGSIHPSSNQQGAGQRVSAEVNRQSDVAQGHTPGTIDRYLEQQRQTQQQTQPTPAQSTGASQPSTAPVFEGDQGAGITPGSLTEAFQATPAINLPDIYENLYRDSGITDKEGQVINLEKQYLEQRGKITDNPFLSASMIDQRLQRLQRKYETETLPLRDEIAMKKADIETQLNLQTKQFDINSTQAKNSLAYFNTLLDIGALDNASGEAIAEITRATGLNSSVIQSAITARSKKDRNLFIDTFTADSGEVSVVTIDKNTGDIVSQQSLGMIGNAQGTGSGLSVSQQTDADYQETRSNLIGDVGRGAILRDLVGHYGGVIDVAEIYRLYNSSSPYGQAKETLEEVGEGKFVS